MEKRSKSNNLIDCEANYTIQWKNGNPNKKLTAICQEIRDKSHKDTLVEGWAQKPTKFFIFLWKIKWGHLNSKHIC